MRLIPARKWAYVLFSALLQIAIFPIAGPLPYWRAFLCWFALISFLVALVEDSSQGRPVNIREAALLGYACGFVWYVGNCYWIYQTMRIYGGLPPVVSLGILILFALYLGLYHALFAVLVVIVRRSPLNIRGALLVAPFAWTAVELARSRITCFPWDLLGYSQVDNLYLSGAASLGGVMFVGFIIAGINAAMVPLFVRTGWKRVTSPLIGFAFAVGIQLSVTHLTMAPVATHAKEQVAVMMQENIEVGAVAKETAPLSLDQELTQFTAASLAPQGFSGKKGSERGWVAPGTMPPTEPTVIIFPEAPSHFMSSDPAFLAAMGKLATTANAPVIAGSLGVDRSSIPQRGYYLYDSASIFNKLGAYVGRYDKIHLVPWGEYIPFKQFFSFADKLTEGVGDMDRGSKRDVFPVAGHRFGVFVCYEAIFGDEVRQFALNNAEVLVNISDDGWYGDSGAPWQHLNMARMRAVENQRWLLRSTNTGVTTAIDPEGQIAFEAPRHIRGAFAFPFKFAPASYHTPYTRFGDWFAFLAAIVTGATLVASALLGRQAFRNVPDQSPMN